MINENDKINEVFDFFFILDVETADIDRGEDEEDEKSKIRLMKKIEKKYVKGIKSFGERMFKTIDDQYLELDEININFKGDLSTRLNFGVFEIGGGVGASISFKLKKK